MARLFKSVLQPGMIVLDIGSYIGYYALLAAQRVGDCGRVLAFEPDPHSFFYLSLNIKTNGLDSIVTPIQKAVSDQAGHKFFCIREDDRSGSSLFNFERSAKVTTVECSQLDEFLDGFFGDKKRGVDIIKMDIEGAELHALKGMERTLACASSRLIMFIECNPSALQAAGGSAAILVDRLKELGFIIMVIDEYNCRLSPISSGIESVKYVNLYCKREAMP
jgi:FkbM family methyltransferase